MDLETLKRKMDEAHYIYDDTLITVLYVALRLNRPLLIEGAAGVGKTEIAKVMAAALGRELVRMQCYEGLDESKSLYEWNYQKQLLSIQVNMGQKDSDELTRSLFSDEYLLERPIRADYALCRATVCDKFGNFYCAKATKNFNYVMAGAADHVIIAAEKVVEIGEVDPDIFAVPGVVVDHIVEGEKPWQI